VPAGGAFLSFVYSLGLGVPFILAAVSFQRAMRAIGFARRHARAVMRTGGALLVLLGRAAGDGRVDRADPRAARA
jgi:cytochrome c-type biogenesis protein